MPNQDQIDFWNGDTGQHWANTDAMIERILGPITQALLDHAPPSGCTRALDIGCGGGSQSIQLARALGPDSSVLGVDISEPMLAVADKKAEEADPARGEVAFLQADASTYAFEPAAFNLLYSRFGVMFFDDPLAAFTNLRNAMADHGRLLFCCWQALKDNDWLRIPLQTALQHLPAPEPADPEAPGPFAFADPVRVERILTRSGFSDVQMTPAAVTMTYGPSPSLRDCILDMVQMSPVGRLLEGQGNDTHETVYAALENTLETYYDNGSLALPGQVWFVTAAVGAQ